MYTYDMKGAPALTARRPSRDGGKPASLSRTESGLPRVLGNGSLAALAAAAGPATLWRCGPVPCDCPAEKRAAAGEG